MKKIILVFVAALGCVGCTDIKQGVEYTGGWRVSTYGYTFPINVVACLSATNVELSKIDSVKVAQYKQMDSILIVLRKHSK